MSKNLNKNSIPIRNKGSKEVRLSGPVIVHVAHEADSFKLKIDSSQPSSNFTKTNSLNSADSQSQTPINRIEEKVELEIIGIKDRQQSNLVSNDIEVTQPPVSQDISNENKQKLPSLTMEQFISQAYSRKGQRVGRLTTKQEKSLSANHKLDQDALARLISEASQDRLLQVPRQLLLAAQAIESHPTPKKVLMQFVHVVMIQHPIFSTQLAQEALSEGAILPSLYNLYQSINSYRPSLKVKTEEAEGADLQKLRINALNLMTLWLFHARHVRIEELMTLLLQSLWKPAAEKLNTEGLQIKALTEIDEPEAIGCVASRYLKSVVDAQSAEQRSHREAVDLRTEVIGLRENLNLEASKSVQLQQQLDALQLANDEAVGKLKQTNQVTRMHLSHDIEVMRGRLIESLQISIERLETGLSAINRELPRIEVMRERAEIVIDNLKSQLKELDRKV